MSGYVLKAAARPVTCVMDWQRGYLAPRERVTADLGWCIQPSFPGSDDLAIVDQWHDCLRSWARLAGGIRGRFYMVSCRVRTNDDRVLSRAVVIRVAMT